MQLRAYKTGCFGKGSKDDSYEIKSRRLAEVSAHMLTAGDK